jgi:superfamily II DNA/RNA helicase
VEQRMVFPNSVQEKREKLVKILNYLEQKFPENHRTMIFVNSKNTARDLYGHLQRNGYHHRINSLHADITQSERQLGLKHMRKDPTSILVATDLGARGIHVDDLACVINFETRLMSTKVVHWKQRLN